MGDIKEKVKPICDIKDKLLEWTKMYVDRGVECVDTDELGDVVDMIKDLAKAEKDCYEAHYYKAIIEAMEEAEEDEELYSKYLLRDSMMDKMGYNPNRSASTGRYTSSRGRSGTGRGGRMGFNHVMSQMPYIKDYLDDGEMDWERVPWGHNERLGYHDMDRHTERDPRHGEAFNNYQMARRHYTETKSEADKDEMHRHANEHVADTITTIREIWSMADPDLKKQMKANFTTLMSEMNV